MNFFTINILDAGLAFVCLLKGCMFFKDDEVYPDFGVFRTEFKWVAQKIYHYLLEACRVALQAFEKHVSFFILGSY